MSAPRVASAPLERRRLDQGGRVLPSVAIFAFTVLFRGWSLDRPRTFVFDEIFYANDALDLFTKGAESTFVGHPPLGKWLISAGFLTGSFTPATWRVSALIAGGITAVLIFLCAEHLTASRWFGLAAVAFYLSDGLAHFIGRYALLDGFAAMFSTAALTVLLLRGDRPMLYRSAGLIGALCGAAIASKWSVAFVLPLAAVICFTRVAGERSLGRAAASAALMVGTAMLVYFASFGVRVVTGAEYGNCTAAACESSVLDRLAYLPRIQAEMLRSGTQLERGSANQGSAWRWPLQDRAFSVAIVECRELVDDQCIRGGVDRSDIRGNRVLWPAALVGVAVFALRRLISGRSVPGVPLVIVWTLALWGPWLAQPHVYRYYAATLVPTLAIASVTLARSPLPERTRGLLLTGALLVGAYLFMLARPGAPWAV
jgi:dolichyl-phosphate-mannose-protein mannosyltransferase